MLYVTGKEGCSFCKMLKDRLIEMKMDFEYIDLMECPAWSDELKTRGITMPANLIYMSYYDAEPEFYTISKEQPLKVPQIADWLAEVGAMQE